MNKYEKPGIQRIIHPSGKEFYIKDVKRTFHEEHGRLILQIKAEYAGDKECAMDYLKSLHQHYSELL